jgi:hypothetical protein
MIKMKKTKKEFQAYDDTNKKVIKSFKSEIDCKGYINQVNMILANKKK